MQGRNFDSPPKGSIPPVEQPSPQTTKKEEVEKILKVCESPPQSKKSVLFLVSGSKPWEKDVKEKTTVGANQVNQKPPQQ